jgi:hypothetical protein
VFGTVWIGGVDAVAAALRTHSTTQCLPKTSPPIANVLHGALTYRDVSKEAARRHQSGQLAQLGVHSSAA